MATPFSGSADSDRPQPSDGSPDPGTPRPDAPDGSVAGDRASYREVLDNLRVALRGPVSLRSTLSVVAELARDSIDGSDGAAVSITTSNPPVFGGSGAFVSALDALQFGLGEGPSVSAIREGRPILLDSADGAPPSRWARFAYEAAELGIGSTLAFPLRMGDELIGSLTLYAYAREAFDERTRSDGAIFARAAGAAVQYARAAHTLSNLATELSDAIDTQATVDVAVGILMHRDRVDYGFAYTQLRRLSAAQQQTVEQTARDLIVESIRRGRTARQPAATERGAPSRRRPPGRSGAGSRSGDRVSDGQTADGRASDGRTADGGTTDGGTADGRTSDGRTADGRASDGRTADGGSDGRSADGRTTSRPPVDGAGT